MWSAEHEIEFFEALTLFKPMGLQRHFMMALILDRLSTSTFDYPREQVWEHLEEMYDLETLDDEQEDPVESYLEKLWPEADPVPEREEFHLPDTFDVAIATQCGLEKRQSHETSTSKAASPTAPNTLTTTNSTSKSTEVGSRHQRKRIHPPPVEEDKRSKRTTRSKATPEPTNERTGPGRRKRPRGR